MGHNITQSALQDEDLTAERLLAGTGGNALLGAGIGGAIPALSSGLYAVGRKVQSTAGHVAPTSARAADSLLGNTLASARDKYTDLASKFSTHSNANIKRVMEAKDVGLDQMNKTTIREQMAKRSAGDAASVLNLKGVTKQVSDELDPELVERTVRRGEMGRIENNVAEMRAGVSDLLADARKIRKEADEAAAAMSDTVRKQAGGMTDEAADKIANKLSRELNSTPADARQMMSKWANASDDEFATWSNQVRGSKSLDTINETVTNYRKAVNAGETAAGSGAVAAARKRATEAGQRAEAQKALKERLGTKYGELRRIAKEADDRVAAAIESGDEGAVFMALDKSRKDYDTFLKSNSGATTKRVRQGEQLDEAISHAQAQREMIASQLSDADAFGMLARQHTAKRASMESIGESGKTFREILGNNPEKAGERLRRYYERVGPESEDAQRLIAHLDNEETLARSLIDSGTLNAAQTKQYQQGLDAIGRLRGDLKLNTERATNLNVLDKMIEVDEAQSLAQQLGVDKALGSVALGAAGYALGGETGAAIGAGMGLGGKLLTAVRKPGLMRRQVAVVQDLAQRSNEVKKRVQSAVGAHLGQLQDLPVKTEYRRAVGSKATGFGAALLAWGSTSAERRETYEKKVKEFRQLQEMPDTDRATWASQTMTRGLDDAAPGVTRAIMQRHAEAVKFLTTKLPPPPKSGNPLQPHLIQETTVTNAEVERMARYFEAIENPLSVIDDWEDGNITREGVEAIKAVYPLLYNEFRETVSVELTKTTKPLPYAEQVHLSVLLDMGTDPFMTAEYQQEQAQRSQDVSPPPEQPGSQGAVPDMAQFALTESEKIATQL
jgi:hypothetical protein